MRGKINQPIRNEDHIRSSRKENTHCRNHSMGHRFQDLMKCE
jgi:hypothetical protein